MMKFVGLSLALCCGIVSNAWAVTSCDQESRLKSANGTRLNMSFVNQSSQTIKLYWLDFTGKRQLYSTLASGRSYQISSYQTHPWVATNSSDQCLAIYLPETDGPTVTMSDAGFSSASAVSSASVNTLLDWIEQTYSNLFPSAGRSAMSVDEWLIRYYPGTEVYVGVFAGRDIYVLGGIFGNQPVFVTTVSILQGIMTTLADPSGNNTFSLTVKERVVSGGSVDANINFQVGQTIQFTLTESALSFNGLTLPFLSNNGTTLTYALINGPTDSSTATVVKTSSGGYSALALYFLRGSLPFINQITYTLE